MGLKNLLGRRKRNPPAAAPRGAEPYLIFRKPKGAGFWSNFSVVLQGIDDADRMGLSPVVDMENYQTLYSEPEPVFGTRNAWEYYFEQPGVFSVEEAHARGAPSNKGEARGRFVELTEFPPPAELVVRARELIANYIRVKPDLLAEIDALLPPGVHPDVLGVHIRGTDLRSGFPGHAVPDVSLAYFEQAKRLDEDYRFKSIFLATDETGAVERFARAFGDRLLTFDAFRLSDAAESSFKKHRFENSRPMHRYRLGKEVLIDSLLLSRCGHLVAGQSSVASSAIYFSMPEQIVHSMPWLWFMPDPDGRRRMTTFPEDDPRQSREVVVEQRKHLMHLLAASEEARAELLAELRTLRPQRLGRRIKEAVRKLTGRTLRERTGARGRSST